MLRASAAVAARIPSAAPGRGSARVNRRASVGIAWFNGSVDQAFEQARAEHKPVFLYWGASWCPPCHELKATVFSRPDFIEKSRLFVPVYLDGDDPGAQRWGDVFHVTGYPTVVILRPDRSELARISGGMDLDDYSAVLDLALGDVRPISDVLASVASRGASLSRDDCRRLAYYAWDLDDDANRYPHRLALSLSRAARRCPSEARLERARLTIAAAAMEADAEQARMKAGAQPSALLRELTRQVFGILEDRGLVLGSADVLESVDDAFFTAARRSLSARDMERRWGSAMGAVANDGDYAEADRLFAVDSQVEAAKALDPSGAIPKSLAAEAEERISVVLARPSDEQTRAGDVNAAMNILDDLGDIDRAYSIAQHEMQTSKSPYYYMLDLADLEEKRGHKDLAIAWLQRAYQESQGPATRFQWGTEYVSGLVRMRPNDDAAIRIAALAVLGELDGPDRIYSRTRVRLEKLDASLRKWNRHGRHAATIAVLRRRMDGICAKLSAGDPAHAACVGFLARA
jgi:thiol-disulfide isomerase/thioredoxin